jgi:hypothetical protein
MASPRDLLQDTVRDPVVAIKAKTGNGDRSGRENCENPGHACLGAYPHDVDDGLSTRRRRAGF